MKNKFLRMKKESQSVILVLLLSAIAMGKGLAQSSMGTDFWVTFLPNYDDGNSLSLIAAGPRACTGSIVNPLTNWSTTFNVNVGTTTIIDIPKSQAYSYNVSDCSLNIGLHVTSTDTISLFASNFQEHTFDVTDVLPTLSLGTDYVVQMYSPAFKGLNRTISERDEIKDIEHDRSEFSIVTTEDNTNVQILLSCNSMNGHYANRPFTITLNAGQCYQLMASEYGDFSGSQISVTNGKKIAVFAGNLCTLVPNNCTACDHIVEQMMPITCWGQHFIITNSMMRSNDIVRITALNNNCQIIKDGNLLTTINARQTYQFEITSSTPAVYLETSEPSSVYLYFTGASCGGENGDPSMVIVSPIEQKISNVTFSTFNSGASQYHYVNIITDSDKVSTMRLDGNNISSDFHPVSGNADYCYARMQVSHGSHTLSNAMGGFVGHVYGLGWCESYAYSVGSMAINLTSQMLVDGQMASESPNGFTYCGGEMVNFDLNLNFTPSQVLWDFDDGQTDTGYPLSHSYSHAGYYQVSCEIYKMENGQNVLVTTLNTFVHVENAALVIDGLTLVAISTDLWPGVYNYCISDSTELSSCTITWECSNPEWMLIPSNDPYWCSLIATTVGNANLTATAVCNSGCNASASLSINASYFDMEENGMRNVSLFPNPTNAHVTIQVPQLSQVRIHNNIGSIVKEFIFEKTDKVSLDISDLKQGVYFVDIITATGNTNKCLIKL